MPTTVLAESPVPLELSRPILPSPLPLTVVSTTRGFDAATGKDRRRVAEGLRDLMNLGPGERVIFGHQVHGDRCVDVDGDETPAFEDDLRQEYAEADALCTRRPGLALVVRTADCVPIAISCARRPWIAVVHAGWRGTYEGILQKTIDVGLRSGLSAHDMHLWVGPHIQGNVYEVSPELAAQFRERFSRFPGIVSGRLLDLGLLNRLQAMESGVPAAQITASGRCTWANPGMFPSFRRDGECRGQICTVAKLGA